MSDAKRQNGSAAVILAEAYHRHRDEIAEAKRILWDELDRDYDSDDSLRTLFGPNV